MLQGLLSSSSRPAEGLRAIHSSPSFPRHPEYGEGEDYHEDVLLEGYEIRSGYVDIALSLMASRQGTLDGVPWTLRCSADHSASQKLDMTSQACPAVWFLPAGCDSGISIFEQDLQPCRGGIYQRPDEGAVLTGCSSCSLGCLWLCNQEAWDPLLL